MLTQVIREDNSLPDQGGYGNMPRMFYYYIAPFYLTGVFLGSYLVVRVLLAMFDFFNFFWDWWDEKKRNLPFMLLFEIMILGGFVYYIVWWELSGTP